MRDCNTHNQRTNSERLCLLGTSPATTDNTAGGILPLSAFCKELSPLISFYWFQSGFNSVDR